MSPSWVFNHRDRFVVVNPPAGVEYEPATVSISGIEADSGATVLINPLELRKEVVHALQFAMNNELYFWSFGNRYRPLQIDGICFNPDALCGGSELDTGGNLLLDWYDSKNAYAATRRTITITWGQKTITALLVGIQISRESPHLAVYLFSLAVIPINVE